MSRPLDPKTFVGWQERLERFSRSELGVAKFCAREGVSEASFYYWRKKLGYKSRRARRTDRRGVFQPVTVVPASSEGVPQAPAICIHLPCGTRIEVGAQASDTVGVGGTEAACAGRGREGDAGSC